MIRRTFLLLAATTATALAAAAPAAATPVCNQTTAGEHSATVCANLDGAPGGGAVVSTNASVVICPDWSFGCEQVAGSVGPTGAGGGNMSNLEIDPQSGGIRSGGGTVATVYLSGIPFGVNVPNFCVGPPEFCPGGGLLDVVQPG